jgi:hypothetical protein
LWIWRWKATDVSPLTFGRRVLGAVGALVMVGEGDDIALLDTATGRRTPIAKPLPGQWDFSGSFSPDGAWFALGLEAPRRERGDSPAELLESLGQPTWTHLVLVECASGVATVPSGRFDNFATDAVWSADSRWLLFDAPFDASLFAVDTHDSEPRLIPVLHRRSRPVPLVNVTGSVT